MFTLIIGKSKSKMFQKAVDTALLLGGEFDGEKITLSIKEEMKAYQRFLPLMRLNVLKWRNTKTYHNNQEVHPYKFMFLAEQKRKTNLNSVLDELQMNSLNTEYTYTKRVENTFFS